MGIGDREKKEPARFAPGSMDQVLSGIDSSEIRERILRVAHESGVQREDPVWTLILLIVEAHTAREWSGKAAQAAGLAADRIRTEMDELPEVIKTSVGSGMDIAANKLREASNQISAAAGAEIVKAQESAKANIAAALGTILENKIGDVVDRLRSQSNRPLHKKWLVALGAGLLVAACFGAWGGWRFYEYAKNIGAADAAAYANPVSKSFYHLMECDQPGWEKKWSGGGKELWCYPHADKDGNQYGWRIR